MCIDNTVSVNLPTSSDSLILVVLLQYTTDIQTTNRFINRLSNVRPPPISYIGPDVTPPPALNALVSSEQIRLKQTSAQWSEMHSHWRRNDLYTYNRMRPTRLLCNNAIGLVLSRPRILHGQSSSRHTARTTTWRDVETLQVEKLDRSGECHSESVKCPGCDEWRCVGGDRWVDRMQQLVTFHDDTHSSKTRHDPLNSTLCIRGAYVVYALAQSATLSETQLVWITGHQSILW